jgi:hypothetical protein
LVLISFPSGRTTTCAFPFSEISNIGTSLSKYGGFGRMPKYRDCRWSKTSHTTKCCTKFLISLVESYILKIIFLFCRKLTISGLFSVSSSIYAIDWLTAKAVTINQWSILLRIERILELTAIYSVPMRGALEWILYEYLNRSNDIFEGYQWIISFKFKYGGKGNLSNYDCSNPQKNHITSVCLPLQCEPSRFLELFSYCLRQVFLRSLRQLRLWNKEQRLATL